MWIAFRFCIFVLWTQLTKHQQRQVLVVNCFQILYIRSLNTIESAYLTINSGCELLSDFVYSFFEHNVWNGFGIVSPVVNCFQILYIRSLNTINGKGEKHDQPLWIAFRFCIFVLWTQFMLLNHHYVTPLWIAFRFCIFVLWTQYNVFVWQSNKVVNCFQILYIRSLNTIHGRKIPFWVCCELLSDFVYSFFEHNWMRSWSISAMLWIAFRFCIFVLWTQYRPIWGFILASCELLSDFVYSFFEHNERVY